MKRSIRVLLIQPAPVTQKYICTATQFCIYRTTGSAAKAGQGECVDIEGSPHRKNGNILWNVLSSPLHRCTHDETTPLNCPWNTRNKCDLAIHQYTFLNNSSIFTFTIPATYTNSCSIKWALILLFVHQLSGEKKQLKKPLPENLHTPVCPTHTA